MSEAGRFDADLRKFARTVNVTYDQVRRKIAFDILRGVVFKTPVDLGRARAAWALSDSGPVGADAGKDFSASPEGAAQRAMNNVSVQKGGGDPFGALWVSNNVPYITALEFGYSDQAPNGMVRVTLAEIEAGILGEL